MLTRIDLQHFKCFEKILLPVAPLTLLTGLNASGKSSVFQALALLNQTVSENEWSKSLILNGDIVKMGMIPDVVNEISGRNELRISLKYNNDLYSWVFKGDRYDMSMDVLSIHINDQSWYEPNPVRYLLPLDPSIKPLIQEVLLRLTYITAERSAPQDVYALEDYHSTITVGPKGENTVSVLHWRRTEPVIDELVIQDVSTYLFHQVEKRMQSFFPGFELDLQHIQRTNSIVLGLRTSRETDFHRPTHTGFGLTHCLPIVVAALSAKPDDIILIENPEAHLHPAGQALMGQFLSEVAKAGVQILVETHSDHVLNGVRRAVKSGIGLTADQIAIHFFRPRAEGAAQVISPTLDDSGNIDHWPEGFFDQFDKDMNYFAGWGE